MKTAWASHVCTYSILYVINRDPSSSEALSQGKQHGRELEGTHAKYRTLPSSYPLINPYLTSRSYQEENPKERLLSSGFRLTRGWIEARTCCASVCVRFGGVCVCSDGVFDRSQNPCDLQHSPGGSPGNPGWCETSRR